MKFDYCISNPPYQSLTSKSREGGVSANKNVFHLFQKTAQLVSKSTIMIYPRW